MGFCLTTGLAAEPGYSIRSYLKPDSHKSLSGTLP